MLTEKESYKKWGLVNVSEGRRRCHMSWKPDLDPQNQLWKMRMNPSSPLTFICLSWHKNSDKYLCTYNTANYKDFKEIIKTFQHIKSNEIESIFKKKCLHFSVHCSPICNGQPMEITKVSLRSKEENTIFAYKHWTWNIMYPQNWRNIATCDKGDDHRRQINDVK